MQKNKKERIILQRVFLIDFLRNPRYRLREKRGEVRETGTEISKGGERCGSIILSGRWPK